MTSYALPSFSEWLHHRDPQLLSEMNRRDFLKAAGMAVPTLAGIEGLRSIKGSSKDDTVKQSDPFIPTPEHLLAYKRVNVLELIKNSVPNPEKFIKDFENIVNPNDQDIGMATRKQMFDREVDMYVTTPEVIDSLNPGAGAYASAGTSNAGGAYIVMPNTYFEELPSKNSYGKLTKKGMQTISHELRHTTQDSSKVSIQRRYAGDASNPEGYKQYMKDPREMGVRLASAKNICDKKYIMNFISYKIRNEKFLQIPKEDIMQIFDEILPRNEKEIFVMLMNPELIDKAFKQNKKYNQIMDKLDEDLAKRRFFMYATKGLLTPPLSRLQNSDDDFSSLYNFYRELPPNEKIQFMHELMTAYDTVVKNPQQNKQISFA